MQIPNQNLWVWGPGICILNKLPGVSVQISTWKPLPTTTGRGLALFISGALSTFLQRGLCVLREKAAAEETWGLVSHQRPFSLSSCSKPLRGQAAQLNSSGRAFQ